MIEFSAPPNDSRGFVHKRIGRAVKGFVTSGFNPLAAAGAFIAPSAPRQTAVRRFSPTVMPVSRAQRKFAPAQRSDAGCGRDRSGNCAPPCQTDVDGLCRQSRVVNAPGFRGIVERLVPGGRTGLVVSPPASFAGGGGEVVMGQYGAGEVPGSLMVDRAVCRRGMVVGTDGICYNRSQISNKERLWPRGRRPLLTGGDMRAISTAARAGKRLEGATKRLQKIGLMKKPARRH